ncbi:hypothetical protein MCP1_310025 [Candidatus Terasakiella magnetica]|nr:hypothetical protein MCP1_310025 [Candidatus Terasakiella magnetica]
MYASINELAKAERVDRAFASRVLRLTLQPPTSSRPFSLGGSPKSSPRAHYWSRFRRSGRSSSSGCWGWVDDRFAPDLDARHAGGHTDDDPPDICCAADLRAL